MATKADHSAGRCDFCKNDVECDDPGPACPVAQMRVTFARMGNELGDDEAAKPKPPTDPSYGDEIHEDSTVDEFGQKIVPTGPGAGLILPPAAQAQLLELAAHPQYSVTPVPTGGVWAVRVGAEDGPVASIHPDELSALRAAVGHGNLAVFLEFGAEV